MSDDGINERRTLPRSQDSSRYQPADEISLFDIWAVLIRRRRQMTVIFLVIVTFTVAYVLLRQRHYTYTTALNIGSYMSNGANGGGKRVLIEPRAVIEQKLKQAFIPIARQKLGASQKATPNVDVDAQGNGSLILLKTRATKGDSKSVSELQQSIADQLILSEKPILKPIQENDKLRLEKASNELSYAKSDAVKASNLQPRKQKIQSLTRQLAAMADVYKSQHLSLQDKIASTQRQLDTFDDARTLLEGKKKRIGQKETLISAQLKEQQNLANQLQKTRLRATGEARNSNDAMTLLMVGTQVDSAQQHIDRLIQKLKVGLPQQKDDIVKSLADNARAKQNAKAQLVSLKAQLRKLENDYSRKRDNQQAKISAAKTAYQKAQLGYQKDIAVKKRNVQAVQVMAEQVMPTRALFTAIRSATPAGPGSILIVTLGCMMGLIFAVFLAFVSEFIKQANNFLAHTPSGRDQRLELGVSERHIDTQKENVPAPVN